MKDSVVGACLLQLLYERRSEGSIPFGQGEQAVPPPGGISRRDWLRALAQLSEFGLIDWTPVEDQSGMGQLSGFAKINDFGVEVLEAGVASPIQSQWMNAGESAFLGGTGADCNEHSASADDYGRTGEGDYRDQSSRCVGAGENEAKTLLRRLLGSKTAVSVLGPGAQSLAAKYFTE